MPDLSGRSGRFRGIRLAVAFCAFAVVHHNNYEAPCQYQTYQQAAKAQNAKANGYKNNNEKDTARIAVSLQNAAESAVHAEAAQQVAGAQLDASEQAVFCFAVNCIIMRTSLK